MPPASASAASSPTPSPCPRCGAPIPPDAPEGLCPRCVAAGNFLTGSLFAPTAARASAAASAPAPTPEELAHIFPQLEIQRSLGRGGMGVVYLARQKSLDRLVALKLLAPERADDPAFAARFVTEAQALARLHHPHIVTVHDFGAAGGYFYLLMEYVDGLNLRQLQQSGRVEPREALAIVPQICDALQYAHDQGVVHRDIKPENILVDRQGRVKVADFGLAKLARPSASDGGANDNRVAAEAVVMGTPAYMSPEQKNHPDRVDHRTDIYALGAVLYEMLTGTRPGTPLQNPSRDVRIDVRLDEVVLRALAHEPALRWQQAGEVKTRLETIAATPPPTPAAASSRRRPLRAALLTLAALVLLGIASLPFINPAPKPPASATQPPATPPPPPARSIGDIINLAPWHTPRELGAKSLARALDTLSGDHVFDGLAFYVDGQITFAGDAFSKNNPREKYPATAEIPLGDRRFDELHLLHVSYYENPHGEPVATIKLHYADGAVAALPLAYGVHLRDWSFRAAEERERLDDPDSKIIFRDIEPNEYGATARIFKTRLANPHPGKTVRALEIVAAPGRASYSLLAAVTANADPARVITPAMANGEKTARVFDHEIRLRVLDAWTGQPVPGALITTSGEYLGSFIIAQPLRTDAAGEAVFRYTRDGRFRARHLGFTLEETSDYASQSISYDLVAPRTAYFFPEPPSDRAIPASGDLPDQLPTWRHAQARALLREYGLNRLAIRERTTPDESAAWGIEHQIEADLGSLVLGTRGEVLWRASQLRSATPSGTADYRAMYSNEAYQRIQEPAERARKEFLAWLWAQAAPGEPAMPLLSNFCRPADTPTRPVDKARLQALIEANRALSKPISELEGAKREEAFKSLKENQAAILAELDGTDLDLAIERARHPASADEIRPSAYNIKMLDTLARQAAERGQIDEMERILHMSGLAAVIFEAARFVDKTRQATSPVPTPETPTATISP